MIANSPSFGQDAVLSQMNLKVTTLSLAVSVCCAAWATSSAATASKSVGVPASDALFDPSRIIQVDIRMDPKDWHALRVSHPVVDENGDFSLTKKGYKYYQAEAVIDGQPVKSVGVRKKGSWGSTMSSRPSLKIKFDNYIKDQEFSGLEMMTLNNLFDDSTKAQQGLVYSFMSKAGVPAPRSNLARVVVNGEDLGVYGNVESIRKTFIKRHFGDAKGDLYENVENADLTTNLMHRIVHKWGKSDGPVELKNLVTVLEMPGLVSLEHIKELVNLEAFITFWAAEVLVGRPDSYPAMYNNFHMYRDATSGKFFFIPWGADGAFVDRQYGRVRAPKSVKAAGYLCQRLWELPVIRERYRKEMRRLLADVWDEKALLAELDRAMRLSAPHRRLSARPGEVGYEQIVEFVNGRRKEMQAELDAPAPDWPVLPPGVPPPLATGPQMQIEGLFSAIMVETPPTNTFEHGSANLEFTVDGRTRKPFTRFGAVAIPSQGPKEFSLVEVVAVDPAGILHWKLQFRIDPYLTIPGKLKLEHFSLYAQLVQGLPGSPKFQRRGVWLNDRLRGTLELDQASRKIGSTISGRFKLNATAFEEEK